MLLEKQITKKLEQLQEVPTSKVEIIGEINIGFVQLGINADSRLGLLVKALSTNTEQAKKTVHSIVEDLKLELSGNDYDL